LSQVQASRDAANDWKLRYDGLESDMLQAQQELAGVRGISRQRDELVAKVREQKQELDRLQREKTQALEHEARAREQLQQVEQLAQDLQQQECTASFEAQQQQQRAEALEANNTALAAMLEESEGCVAARQQQLEETLQRLDALETVRRALDLQVREMDEERVGLERQLQAAAEDAASRQVDRNELLHQIHVLEGVRKTLEGRRTCAEQQVSTLQQQLENQRLAAEEQRRARLGTERELGAERACTMQLRLDVAALQGETARQQQDIDALARRNTELVGVRASLARRLKAAEDTLSQARTQNKHLLASMQAERVRRVHAEKEADESKRVSRSRQQEVAQLHAQLANADNVPPFPPFPSSKT